MAYIAKVRIQGFQSHLDSTFMLSPGLNVITGPSDAGKTAIIRALRWLAFNEPQGEAFIHAIRDTDGNIIQSADRATVTVEFDDGTVITKTRRKGKTVYTHSDYPDAWEKAELPLEIKNTLGLMKQRYGENFDTCLNFAYQLDPPFLLSETGSTGAKVLGKLAGTEIVDKAIGVITKRTHQTREIIRQSEKAVGQYDVELLDYIHTEESIQTVERLEKQFTDIETAVSRHGNLSSLSNQLQNVDDRITRYSADIERLQEVDTLRTEIDRIEGLHDIVQRMRVCAKSFWDCVNRRKSLKATIQELERVPELTANLQRVKVNTERLTSLQVTVTRYTRLTDDVTRFKDILSSLTDIDSLTDYLKATIRTKANRLAELQSCKAQYERRKSIVATATDTVEGYTSLYATAKKELADAWAAAGGVCPLCNQPVKGDALCTH